MNMFRFNLVLLVAITVPIYSLFAGTGDNRMYLTSIDLLFWAMSFIGHVILLSVLVLRDASEPFPSSHRW